jgi:hypothetical protein
MKRTLNPTTPQLLMNWLNDPSNGNAERMRICELVQQICKLQALIDQYRDIAPGDRIALINQMEQAEKKVNKTMACYRGHLGFHRDWPAPLTDGPITDDFYWDWEGKHRFNERLAIITLIGMAKRKELNTIALCEECKNRWFLKHRVHTDKWCSVKCRKSFHRKNMTPKQRAAYLADQRQQYIARKKRKQREIVAARKG